MPNKTEIAEWFKGLQDRICSALEQEDGKATFEEDLWQHHSGGGGRTRLIQNGNVFEKGGVNFSQVQGELSPMAQKALGIEGAGFFATGVSIVIHPESPLVPIIHMNVRYFELDSGRWWFGGGIDLTPIYVVPEDARFFHAQMKGACDDFDAAYYPEFKAWADRYFYIKHREETRGIGGIFFDRLEETDSHNKQQRWDFVKRVGDTFAPTYTNIVSRHKQESHTPEQKEWQMLRRGRYVEFNLVLDRGTKFGLETGGRTESILMSLPKVAGWAYDHQPAEGSAERDTLNLLKQGVDWV